MQTASSGCRPIIVDIYIMHRDNPEVPVGEFVDVLNEHVKAGRIRALRRHQLDAGARSRRPTRTPRSKGLQGFALVSNNFSLARMVDPRLGRAAFSRPTPALAEVVHRTQMPLFAWSQPGPRLLPGRPGAPDKKDDAELVRCWYADDNFQRLERANELAKKHGVPADQHRAGLRAVPAVPDLPADRAEDALGDPHQPEGAGCGTDAR